MQADNNALFSAPLIETERLPLRHFRARDLDAFAETMANPDVVRHMFQPPS